MSTTGVSSIVGVTETKSEDNGTITTWQLELGTRLACTCIILMTFTMCCYSNGVMLVTTFKSKRFRTEFGSIVVNLSVADSILCVVCGPFVLYFINIDHECYDHIYSLAIFLYTTASCVSLGSVNVISLHRLLRVTKQGHIRSYLTSRSVTLIIILLWLFSTSLGIGALSASLVDEQSSCLFLHIVPDKRNIIYMFIGPLGIFTLLIMTISYYSIVVTMWKQRTLTEARSSNDLANVQPHIAITSPDMVNTTIRSHSYSTHVTLHKDSRALCMCVLLVMMFLLNWLPFIIATVMDIAKISRSNWTMSFNYIALSMTFLQSAVNPFLYAYVGNSDMSKYHCNPLTSCCQRCCKTQAIVITRDNRSIQHNRYSHRGSTKNTREVASHNVLHEDLTFSYNENRHYPITHSMRPLGPSSAAPNQIYSIPGDKSPTYNVTIMGGHSNKRSTSSVGTEQDTGPLHEVLFKPYIQNA